MPDWVCQVRFYIVHTKNLLSQLLPFRIINTVKMYAFLDKTEQILNKLSKFVAIIETLRQAI